MSRMRCWEGAISMLAPLFQKLHDELTEARDKAQQKVGKGVQEKKQMDAWLSLVGCSDLHFWFSYVRAKRLF